MSRLALPFLAVPPLSLVLLACADANIGDRLGQDASAPSPDAGLQAPPDGGVASIVVCPGIGPSCDYLGGDGLQQAVLENPGTPELPTRILLRSGLYLRTQGSAFVLGDLEANALLLVNGQFVDIRAEEGAQLDGQGSAAMIGLATLAGQLSISGLKLGGFHDGSSQCTSLGCPAGYAIAVYENASFQGSHLVVTASEREAVTVRGTAQLQLSQSSITASPVQAVLAQDAAQLELLSTRIASSAHWALAILGDASAEIHGCILEDNAMGAYVGNQAQAIFRNNLLVRNFNGIYATDAASLVIENNTFDSNEVAAINSYHCGEHDPGATIRDNIIVNTRANIDNSFGFPVGGPCWMEAEGIENDTVSHNLVWQNFRENQDCLGNENCGQGERLFLDPLFLGTSDYHLLGESPGVDSGGGAGPDPDGSALDRGAYGGPGACLLDPRLAGC